MNHPREVFYTSLVDDYLKNLRTKIGHDLIKAPAAGMIVRDADGKILLLRRSDDGTWGIPGGWASPGEGILETAKREVLEETGYAVANVRLLGIYSDPRLMAWTYPNGDQAEFVSVVFEAEVRGEPGARDGEALEVRFFAPHELPNIRRNDAAMVEDAISDVARPVLR